MRALRIAIAGAPDREPFRLANGAGPRPPSFAPGGAAVWASAPRGAWLGLLSVLSLAACSGAPAVAPAPDAGPGAEDASPVAMDAEAFDAAPPAADAAPDASFDAGEREVADAGGLEAGTPTRARPLSENRDRIFATYARRQGMDVCAAWQAMDASQRGVFLTITDLLGKRSWLHPDPDGGVREGDRLETALDHVVELLAVRGSNSGCGGLRCCGGGEYNRLYFVADEALIAALRGLQNVLPAWRRSRDLGGPHDPFTQSNETDLGPPRGQCHFFAEDVDTVVLERAGVEGVYEPWAVELDLDYNILHESASECTYGDETGRERYERVWSPEGIGGSAELGYRPSGCP